MSEPLSPAGFFRGIRVALNGATVTIGELQDYWAEADPGCTCAPGLGYICPSHRPGPAEAPETPAGP